MIVSCAEGPGRCILAVGTFSLRKLLFLLLSIIMVEVSAIKSSNQRYFQEDFVSVVRFLVGKRPILTSKIGNFV